MLLVDSSCVSATSKIIETNKGYYVNGVHYDRYNMNPTIFKCFCDNGLTNSFCFDQTLAPNFEQKYFTGLRTKNILVDNNNPEICYVSNYNKIKSDYALGIGNGFQINIFENATNLYKQTYYNNIDLFNWGYNFTKWLGQNDTHLYLTVVKNSASTTPNNTSSPVSTIIIKIKKSFTNISDIAITNSDIMYTFPKCNGDIIILKETDTVIYLVSELSGYQYEFGKIIKTSNTYQTIKNFKILVDEEKFYQDMMSSGVRASFNKINEDEYECFFSGREIINNEEQIYKNLIQKAIINTNLETVDIKEVTLDDEPYFGHKFGDFYNTITYFENKDKKYLITSTNIFYDSTTKFNNTDKIISMYEIDDSMPDTITGTLADKITITQLSGDYYGMLFNKELNSLMLLTSITSYILDIDFITKKFKLRNLNVFANEIGIDLNNNYWAIDPLTNVYLFNKEAISEIKVEAPKIVDYDLTPTFDIQVAGINYEGDYISQEVVLKIDGDANFTDDMSKVKTLNTLDTGFKEVSITLNSKNDITILPEVPFKSW